MTQRYSRKDYTLHLRSQRYRVLPLLWVGGDVRAWRYEDTAVQFSLHYGTRSVYIRNGAALARQERDSWHPACVRIYWHAD